MGEVINRFPHYNGMNCPYCSVDEDWNHEPDCQHYRPQAYIHVDDHQEMTITKIGWECPVCHRGLSPDVTVCHHGQDPKDLIAPVGSSKTINVENQWDSFSWQEQE